MSTPPELESDSAVQLFLAWMEEREKGEVEAPSFEELCSRHPDLRPRLMAIGASHETARLMLEPGGPPEGDARAPESTLAGTRYEPRGEIARGGMGAIFEAYDPDLHRTIAVKVLRERQGSGSSTVEADRARHGSRLLSEAQILAQLDHPGVVPVHEVGLDDRGSPYFTMKRVEGEDFQAVIRAHHAGDAFWRLTRAVAVLKRVSEAVAYAHSKGVIHRDLKPANVMVGRFGEVFVMDWGLAKVVGQAERPGEAPARTVLTERSPGTDASGSPETQHGALVGTPGYIAPELATGEGRKADARTDVYAIGAMLYHLLAGHTPHGREAKAGLSAFVEALFHGGPEPLARAAPDAPDELVAICEKAMARDPERRYPTALDLAGDLEAWMEGRVVQAHRTGAWVELRKWIGRNRGAATAAVTVVLGLGATTLVELQGKRELARQGEELRREDSFNRIALASAAFSNGDIIHMQELLAGCPEDLRGWEWNYLSRAADSSTRVLHVPGLDVKSAYVLDDGHTLLAAGGVGPARILLWDLPGERIAHEITLPEGCAINNVSFSADGSRLAAFARSGELLQWDTRDWSPLPPLDARMHGWHGVSFAPRGTLLAAYGTEGVQLWDVGERVRVAELSAGQADISDVTWSPDGRRLCAASWDGSVSVWDAGAGELVAVLRESTERMQQVEWSPDGRWIAGGDWDSRVHVWDAGTLAQVHLSDRVGGHILALAWSPDSALLAVGGVGVVIQMFEAGTWEPAGRLIGHTASVQSLSFAFGGRTLVSGSTIGSVRFWDLDRAGWRTEYREAGREPPAGVAFAPDGARAAVAWGSGTVEIWDTALRERVRGLDVGATIRHLDWSRGQPGIAVACWERDVVVLDPDGAAPPRRISVPEPTEVHFDPSGARLAATAQDGKLRVWDAASGALSWEQAIPVGCVGWPGNLFGASWSPDGEEVVASTFDGRIQVRDADTGELRRETRRPRMLFTQYCRDGRHILAWAYTGLRGMELLDGKTLAPIWTSEQTIHMWPVLSPDCERVFSANWQGFLGVWDASSGRLVAEIEGLPPGNPRLAVAPDGDRVVLAAGNRLRFFEAR